MIDLDFSLLKGLDYKIDLPTNSRSTLKAGGKIAVALFPQTRADLLVLKDLTQYSLIVLGNMSNVAVREGGYQGIAVMTDRLLGLDIEGDYIYVGAGERLPSVVTRLSRLDYIGLERLGGIPASIGGAIAMNAGAFSQEIGEVVEEVIVCDIKQGCTYRLSQKELGFYYRKTNILAGREMVVGAILKLKKGSNVLKECEKYNKKRQALQPHQPSLGSVFLKDQGISAGYYIDKCGYKGYVDSGIEVSKKHANFIVNIGGGTVTAYERVKDTIKAGVKAKTGIILKEEVRIIGQDENRRTGQK